jgi:tetratricopeptide (TPR) repeat protein
MRKAQKWPAGSLERIAALKEAWRIDPRNGETAYDIGEQLRARAWSGDLESYRELTLEAIQWFEKAATLNQWDVNSLLRIGMCWDWLEEFDKAEPYFAKALKLDPNHFHTCAMMGWHHYQAGEFAQVRSWMMRSLELWANDNAVARQYLVLAEKALADPARRNGGVSAPQTGNK